MNESVLKKEFKKADVQRMRNLISGRSGDATKTQAGWEKHRTDHREGDVWEESGKTWTIKNGIKQNITKMDEFAKLVQFPIACPKCKSAMKPDELNKKAYSLNGTCLSCMIEEETELKRLGKYEDHEKEEIKKAQYSYVNDLENMLDAWYNSEEAFVNEQGDVENWGGGNKTKMYEMAKKELEKLKNY
jgi:hypothetical protein